MKRFTCPAGRVQEMTLEHPERTARREASGSITSNSWGDVVFQVWPNRASMAHTIRMQERAGTPNPWRAVVKLSDGEGYYGTERLRQ